MPFFKVTATWQMKEVGIVEENSREEAEQRTLNEFKASYPESDRDYVAGDVVTDSLQLQIEDSSEEEYRQLYD